MKICHITSAHKRYDARIFLRECVSLAKVPDNEVILVCCDGKPEELKEGIRIISYSSEKMPKKARFKLLYNNRSFIDYLLQLDADVYQFHDFELIEVGRKLARKSRNVIFDSHENWPGYVAELIAKPYSWLYGIVVKLIGCYYKRILNNFKAIFSVSPNMVDELQKFTSTPVYMVPNYPFANGMVPSQHLDKKNIFVYQGTVYSISNQITVAKAIQNINDASYNIIGTISEQLKYNVQQTDINGKVEFTGWITPEELDNRMSECLAGIVVLDYAPACCGKEGQLGSNKIFEYMKMGLPVICTDFDLWQSMIIDKYQCGISIPPQNVEKMEEAMKYMISHKNEAFEMGRRGQRAIQEEFCWELYEREFVDRYESFVK